ncbi:MAG: YraN family protein [Flavobacteriia bacterium]|nr:YraN family protein [Flavobacteriia bacterium]
MAIHNDIGKKGERIARQYLESKGYLILETNYRLRKAEIDLIVTNKDYLVVVEVKTRSHGFLKSLSHTITPSKINLLIRAANYYVQSRKIHKEVRFDIVSVIIEGEVHTIDHLIDAFYHF